MPIVACPKCGLKQFAQATCTVTECDRCGSLFKTRQSGRFGPRAWLLIAGTATVLLVTLVVVVVPRMGRKKSGTQTEQTASRPSETENGTSGTQSAPTKGGPNTGIVQQQSSGNNKENQQPNETAGPQGNRVAGMEVESGKYTTVTGVVVLITQDIDSVLTVVDKQPQPAKAIIELKTKQGSSVYCIFPSGSGDRTDWLIPINPGDTLSIRGNFDRQLAGRDSMITECKLLSHTPARRAK